MICTWRTIRDRVDRPEAGLSLVELIVAMALLSLVLLLVMGFFMSGTNAYLLGQTIDTNTRNAANGMNEISRYLRAATDNPVQNQPINDPAFTEANNEAVTFYAYVNLASSTEQPVKVRFSLDAARRVIETRWSSYVISSGYWGFNTTPVSTRIFSNTVVNQTGSNPFVFTYLKADGTTVAVPTGGIIDPNVLRTIAAVRLTMQLGTSATATSSVTLQNTVGLPNLGIARTR